ncbi:MAG: acetate kinase [Muribaculaceae bacterium]|nr:acetate kinase [Muribaculaceae bacterium]
MNILVLNCGSSSVKYKLIEVKANKILAEGGIEKVGLPGPFIKFKDKDGKKRKMDLDITDHVGAIKAILDNLTSAEFGCIGSFNEIDAVGHRVVHGGEKFNKSVLINDEVVAMIKECYGIAPLHNPVNMAGIDAISAVLPEVPQVAVFDTAFHQTMPAKAYMYALPYKYYKEDHVRRYGFHGTSHRYVSKRVCDFLNVDYKTQRVICCHIGNGGSITAVENGRSIDTSMGLTPTEGLMMGTRCGDLDPGAILFLMVKHNLSAKDMLAIVNKKSGMLGVTEISSDMREIDQARANGSERARMGLDMYCHRITKYVGAYAAEMNGADIIVFTGGVGEHQADVRELVCSTLGFMGVELDKEANNANFGEEQVISTPESKVKVVVIPTDEEYMIAHDTEAIVEGREP